MIFSYKTSKQPHDSHHVSHSEVSCRDTVRQARITRVKSKGVRKLGKVKLKRSESGAHHVFRKFGASLEIKLSKTNLPTKNGFPYVSFTNWVRYLMEYDRLEHLVGVRDEKLMKKTLGTFWDRFKERNPEHVAFTRGPSFPLDSLIPVLFHGDEGRGLKKKQIMVLSTHGLLGKGSSRHPKASAASEDPLKMNYKGNTWKNHFLLCCMPVSLYGDDPSALFQMLDIQAEEFSRLFWDGVEFGGRRLYVACVGIKGDSPFLSKAGMFNRAFTRRPTRSSSKTPCKGVCHLCMAGCESYDYDVPYEEFGNEFPSWLGTMGLVKPYETPSPLLKIPFHRGGTTEALFEFDLFHNFHQGVGKNFAASAICICLELVRNTISGAFDELTSDFKQYCSQKKESPYHKKITAKLVGVETGFKDWPDAAWSKGDFTRLILQWFGDYCKRCVVGHTVDPLYLKCVPKV